mmetsp:Transcript_27530/g.72709  ORF Transcript_27530/g.72709 Transcript_27530/m.72709 type:complete len:317 (+) Transcript_27530:103-1053(+)
MRAAAAMGLRPEQAGLEPLGRELDRHWPAASPRAGALPLRQRSALRTPHVLLLGRRRDRGRRGIGLLEAEEAPLLEAEEAVLLPLLLLLGLLEGLHVAILQRRSGPEHHRHLLRLQWVERVRRVAGDVAHAGPRPIRPRLAVCLFQAPAPALRQVLAVVKLLVGAVGDLWLQAVLVGRAQVGSRSLHRCRERMAGELSDRAQPPCRRSDASHSGSNGHDGHPLRVLARDVAVEDGRGRIHGVVLAAGDVPAAQLALQVKHLRRRPHNLSLGVEHVLGHHGLGRPAAGVIRRRQTDDGRAQLHALIGHLPGRIRALS